MKRIGTNKITNKELVERTEMETIEKSIKSRMVVDWTPPKEGQRNKCYNDLEIRLLKKNGRLNEMWRGIVVRKADERVMVQQAGATD